MCLSTKFPHQEIRWNYGIFHSAGLQPWSKKCFIRNSSNSLEQNLSCNNTEINDIDDSVLDGANLQSTMNNVLNAVVDLEPYQTSM